ncbi:hypothetical protein ParaKuw1_00032 [Paracoccus phage ParKuw1]|uniref:Uncharacterized protein n=1 Tax=Paracoccus phage ParKuw1 TaxID=3032415 RepID=A0AAF0FNP6_9CAUD|nr:hypothetical protein ParaKuw1_00032 [Paracoccus phage ParKuw1]
MIVAALRLAMWLFWTGLILWVLWLVAYGIMAIFPYTAAITVGIFGTMAFIAWRRSRGH